MTVKCKFVLFFLVLDNDILDVFDYHTHTVIWLTDQQLIKNTISTAIDDESKCYCSSQFKYLSSNNSA